MLIQAVESYLDVRRAMGFALHSEGALLKSFAKYSKTAGKSHICMETAIQWTGLAQSVTTRARRLGQVIRLARYLRAESQSHEVPPAVFGREKGPRRVPYIFSAEIPSGSSKQHPNLAVGIPFADRPTARFSPYWRAQDFVCRRRSSFALKTSPRTD
jgi:hypothetical protein